MFFIRRRRPSMLRMILVMLGLGFIAGLLPEQIYKVAKNEEFQTKMKGFFKKVMDALKVFGQKPIKEEKVEEKAEI